MRVEHTITAKNSNSIHGYIWLRTDYIYEIQKHKKYNKKLDKVCIILGKTEEEKTISHYPWKRMKILYLNILFSLQGKRRRQNKYFHENQKINVLNCISLSIFLFSTSFNLYICETKFFILIFHTFFIYTILLLVYIYLCLYESYEKTIHNIQTNKQK